MTDPVPPSGYDDSHLVDNGRGDCKIGVGFDRQKKHIPSFLVVLHYRTQFLPSQWDNIARFDHNERGGSGHDVYQQGIHFDMKRNDGTEVTKHPQHTGLPQNRGKVIRWCVDYFKSHADFFIDYYEGRTSGQSPPSWPP